VVSNRAGNKFWFFSSVQNNKFKYLKTFLNFFSCLVNSVLQGLVKAGDTWDISEIAKMYLFWINSGPFDIGRTCGASMSRCFYVQPP
jgi:hypothetical protein